MKTRKYKTIKGLLKQCYGHELDFNNFTSRTFYHDKSSRWCKFGLPDEEIELAVRLFADVLYGRVTINQLNNILHYHGPSYGILTRLTIQKKSYDKEVRGTYCAGQDYPAEIKTIQKILR